MKNMEKNNLGNNEKESVVNDMLSRKMPEGLIKLRDTIEEVKKESQPKVDNEEALLCDIEVNPEEEIKATVKSVQDIAMGMKRYMDALEELVVELANKLQMPESLVLKIVTDSFIDEPYKVLTRTHIRNNIVSKKNENKYEERLVNYFNESSIDSENVKNLTKKVAGNAITEDKRNNNLRDVASSIDFLNAQKILNSRSISVEDDEMMDISIQRSVSSFETDNIVPKCDGMYKKCNSCIGLSDEGVCEVTGVNMNSISITECNDFEDK